MIGIASNELDTEEKANMLMYNAMGLEFGRIICRDIGGSDPERMNPGKVEVSMSNGILLCHINS